MRVLRHCQRKDGIADMAFTATEVGIKTPGVIDFFKSGLKTVIDMWFVILPVVVRVLVLLLPLLRTTRPFLSYWVNLLFHF